jgi:hypothetical protein
MMQLPEAAIDGYLLAGSPVKAEAVKALLATRSEDPRAQPFYRAFEAVGARAADEAFIALRLLLAGIAPEDEPVRHVRGLVAAVRAGGAGAFQARADYEAAVAGRR